MGIGPLLNAIVDLLPNPTQVNPHTAHGKSGEEQLTASDSGPLAAYVWKTTADQFVGKVTYFRLYSGTIQADAHFWNQNKTRTSVFRAASPARQGAQIPVKVIHAGDIGSVSKLTVSATGDTFSDKGHPLTIAPPKFPAALYRVAISPNTQGDAAKISPTLTLD